jgi:DNA mismatch repair protein MutL
VNVHPAKTEVKFGDDKVIYQLLKSAVRKAIGGFNPVDEPDFNPAILFDSSPASSNDFGFIPKFTPMPGSSGFPPLPEQKNHQSNQDWKKIFDPFLSIPRGDEGIGSLPQQESEQLIPTPEDEKSRVLFIPDRFILVPMKNQTLVIDAQTATQRILFEQFLGKGKNRMATQEKLFPKVMEFTAADFVVLEEVMPILQEMGFDLSPMGNHSATLYGIPANIETGNEEELIRTMIGQLKNAGISDPLPIQERLAKSLSIQLCYKPGKWMQEAEMKQIVDSLFGCAMSKVSPDGRTTFRILDPANWLKVIAGM